MRKDGKTSDLERMLSTPERAIRSMAPPLLISFLIANLQLFIDSFWCSGLGPTALAAISITGSLYWVIVDVGNGMGVGVSTAIARALGAENQKRANSIASQAVILTIVLAAVTSAVIIAISEPLLRFMGGGDYMDTCMDYLIPYLVFSFPVILYGVMNGMIRAEGAATRSMYISVSASILNIILDPVLIYGLNLGVGGAALATCVSFTAVILVGAYWYRSEKMYIRLSFRGFRFRKSELDDIFVVGIPHTAELVLVPLMIVPQNALVSEIGGQDGIVCNFTPFRYISLAQIVAQSFAEAMIPVGSAAIGQKDFVKTKRCFWYTTRICLIVGIILSAIVFIFAEPLSYAFTYSDDMARFQKEFTKVIRIYSPIILFLALISVSSGILQVLEYSKLAMITIFVRECMFITLYWLATSMNGIYWSMTAAEGMGAFLMAFCALYAIKCRGREFRTCHRLTAE